MIDLWNVQPDQTSFCQTMRRVREGRFGPALMFDVAADSGCPTLSAVWAFRTFADFNIYFGVKDVAVDLANGMCCHIRNLYARMRPTITAKISSAGTDLRAVGIVAWRAADRPGSSSDRLWTSF